MECGDWSCWPWWTPIGTIAQIVSLAAIAFAIYELLLQRRRVPPVAWGLDVFGSATINGRPFHVAELYNAGTGTASVITAAFAGSRPEQVDGYRCRSLIGSGERVEILLTSKRLGDAWFYVVWSSSEDATLIHVRWMPVAAVGAMRDKWEASFEKTPRRRWWSGIVGMRNPRPVGPEHYVSTSYRYSRNSVVNERRLSAVFKGLGEGEFFPWMAGSPTADLPYVEPRQDDAT